MKEKKEKKSSKPAGKPYVFLDHTADIMFEAWGKDFKEALENAAHAMFSIMGHAQEKESFTLHERARSPEELVVYTLSALLSNAEAKEMVISRVQITALDEKENSLSLTAYGEKKQPRDAIKAVTFHEFMLKEEKGKCTIRILLDV
ncbi:Protein archease [Candidatus Anstonella stagnisolia]|nr:Protein archease [Candidatus Anstonella stagnisolia]